MDRPCSQDKGKTGGGAGSTTDTFTTNASPTRTEAAAGCSIVEDAMHVTFKVARDTTCWLPAEPSTLIATNNRENSKNWEDGEVHATEIRPC